MSDDRLPDLSTRPGRRPPRALDLLLLSVSLALLALSGQASWRARSQLRQARDAVERIGRETKDEQARARRLTERTRGSSESLVSPLLLTTAHPPPHVVADLAELLPPDVRFDSLDIRYGEAVAVELRVSAQGPRAYDRFLAALEQSPRFADLEPGREEREGQLSSRVRAAYVGAPQ